VFKGKAKVKDLQKNNAKENLGLKAKAKARRIQGQNQRYPETASTTTQYTLL